MALVLLSEEGPPQRGAVIVVAAAIVATYFLYDFVVHHTYLGERFQTTINEGGDVQRFGMYTRGIELFLENPVAGIGFGQFQEVSGFEEYSHSDYIEVLSSTGIVGFVLYFSIFLVLWLRIARLRRLTSDPEITYALGVFKAVICVTLMMQFVYPKMLSPEHWYWMAPIIGYTYGLSLDFAERAAANGEAGRLAVSPPRGCDLLNDGMAKPPRRIAIITTNYPSPLQPAFGTFVEQFVRAVARRGMECTVICPTAIH